MKNFFFLMFLLCGQITDAQLIYKTLKGRIDFSSLKGMNLLEAYSENLYLKFDSKTNDLNLKVQITSFSFTNCSKSVEKTFNDSYMESHKFHWAKFEGKLIDSVDFKTPGNKEVTAEGKLFIHGVEQIRKIKGTIIVKDGDVLIFSAKFPVALVDHQIIILNEDIDRLATGIEVKIYAETSLIK